MQIEEYALLTQHHRSEDSRDTREHSAFNTDATFFSAMLAPSTSARAPTDSGTTLTILAELSELLKAKENRMARALKSSSNSTDMTAFNEYPRELSGAVITSQLMVKSLGKATQCIDKICNLQ
ncbi:hypothetical protein cym2001_09020 [Pseudomonas sp. CYM-20-01]|jgi:hypothetical protein|uniref:EscI/YscI/HrpB family type III secretion system inner rod protein n=1 Tax=Pseudomonas sp. CYM-20-01 TaxID=2870750 RepID=UPI00206937C2|nr:EscI/YscI/HrpB family type III secretion system inner rod protein [Pseudomonas sp. CYM-20-01]BDB17537.1 hypothetical protein cym2001_09020 [Pseudomonas sp. CYM-20-01]